MAFGSDANSKRGMSRKRLSTSSGAGMSMRPISCATVLQRENCTLAYGSARPRCDVQRTSKQHHGATPKVASDVTWALEFVLHPRSALSAASFRTLSGVSPNSKKAWLRTVRCSPTSPVTRRNCSSRSCTSCGSSCPLRFVWSRVVSMAAINEPREAPIFLATEAFLRFRAWSNRGSNSCSKNWSSRAA